jgi:2,4-dienoyl-CoA reductase (NADPH2)
LHIIINDAPKILNVDTIILCAGQEPLNELVTPLQEAKQNVHRIGGVLEAHELDAVRAIRQGAELGAKI